MGSRFLAGAFVCLVCCSLWLATPGFGEDQRGGEPDARAILQAAIDHWRGTSSYAEVTMIIHRPEWERRMAMRAWTRGEDHSLVRVMAPPRDGGSGTLLIDKDMWSFAPNINRVVKVPSSMMAQSWMGSDFSNQDIARADDILDHYEHRLLQTETTENGLVYYIEAIPHEMAPVVWGRQVVQVREDHLVLQEDYYDQDDRLVKRLVTHDIATMDDRAVARVQRMSKLEEPGEWTEVRIDAIDFGVELEDRVFTLSNLRNPRQ
ncbi:outer membrane lipoprotein-sorting protein [Kineobactrum sediminis]|uniref:Outer membrane lipoprotein-sorting protein n=1 Tax=Kineobactrum sediminis TaxID=1905677 RepID=A0A2N5Y1B3_9GAMM|nr:outer membrane lipoprotein-sorting protein [Kineobactrum sediminis]PLW82182.1 outer membrane lipoprotein-sorting protein [Kineobactrum sediminis]